MPNDLLMTFWGSACRKTLTSFFATVTAIATAVVAVPPAWSALGLPEVASRVFVLEKIQAKIDPMLKTESQLLVAQAQQQQTLNQILISQLQSSLYAAKRDMANAPSQTVQDRIDALQRQIDDLQKSTGSSR
jgi:hypothetical protein